MTGMSYAPVDVDALDDDKVFSLMRELGERDGAYDPAAAFAAYGRLVALLQRVYRDGFYLKMGKMARMRLSYALGMSQAELDAFVGACVEYEVFDRALWEGEGVLTSRGVQRRYFRAKRRGEGELSDEDRRYLLGEFRERYGECAEACAQERGGFAETGAQVRGSSADTAATVRAQEKLREEKLREEEEEGDCRAGARSRSSSSSSEPWEGKRGRALGCMRRPAPDGTLFRDSSGSVHETPAGALAATLSAACPGETFERFSAEVADLCPPSCRGTPEQVARCGQLMATALGKFDPAKATSPVPLVRKVVKQDRGEIDG